MTPGNRLVHPRWPKDPRFALYLVRGWPFLVRADLLSEERLLELGQALVAARGMAPG